MSETAGRLAGLRVLDASNTVAGAYAGQLLADLGADVVKVETLDGDPLRRLGALESDGVSLAYKVLNAGKRLIRLDLRETVEGGEAESGADKARKAFDDLLAAADVLIDSAAGSLMRRLTLSVERLAVLNARLVHVTVSPWGSPEAPAGDGNGPRAGHDINIMAVAGGLAMNGASSGPTVPYPPVSDYATGQQVVIAVLSGLLARDGGMTGAQLASDLAQMDTVLAWQNVAMAEAAAGRVVERGRSLRTGGAACYRCYRTADNAFVAVGAIERRFWVTFCNALEHPEWIGRQWEDMPQHGLIAEVAETVRRRSVDDWMALLRDLDCCVEPVLSPVEVAGHAHIRARGAVRPSPDGTTPIQVMSPLAHDAGAPRGRDTLRPVEIARLDAEWRVASTQPVQQRVS